MLACCAVSGVLGMWPSLSSSVHEVQGCLAGAVVEGLLCAHTVSCSVQLCQHTQLPASNMCGVLGLCAACVNFDPLRARGLVRRYGRRMLQCDSRLQLTWFRLIFLCLPQCAAALGTCCAGAAAPALEVIVLVTRLQVVLLVTRQHESRSQTTQES